MKQPQKRAQILLAVALLLYACGYVTQFIGNYAVWQKNGGMLGGTSPPFPSLSPLTCLKGVLWFPYNLYCMAGCAAAVAVIFLYRKLFSQDALTDSERNFDFSAKGTYGTSGWMQTREVPAVLDMVSDLSQHTGTVLGMLDGKFLCIPEKTRMNGNLAVYGASGSMKTRSFCIQNKEKQNTDLILSEGEAVRTKVRDNIELDLLCRNQPESAPVMQEIYELVVETIQLRSPVLRLGNNLFPMALVRERLLQLTSEHIRFVLDGLRNLHTDVKNLKKYLLTMLFNAPVTLNGRTMLDVRKSVGGGFRPMLA